MALETVGSSAYLGAAGLISDKGILETAAVSANVFRQTYKLTRPFAVNPNRGISPSGMGLLSGPEGICLEWPLRDAPVDGRCLLYRVYVPPASS